MNKFSGLALAMMMATGAEAQTKQEPIRVAIIDVHPDRLDCNEEGVTMIDVTPPVPEGFRPASAKAARTSHGVLVVTSFVNEVRRISPGSPIEIYTINPFIKKGPREPDMFSMKMLKAGMSNLDGKGVKTAVITFSVDSPADGERIASQFLSRGMILFAAAPNEPKDLSIYPAATPGVISIAEAKTGASIHQDPTYKSFTSFVIDGYYMGRSGEATGSSFATPKAAAYASIMVSSNPSTTTSDVRKLFESMGKQYRTLPEGVKKIGGEETVNALRAMIAIAENGHPKPNGSSVGFSNTSFQSR